MLSGGLLAWIAVRRRQALLGALPAPVQESIQERIVLPFTAFSELQPDDAAEDTSTGGMTRKVGSNRRISVHGKLYGPLDSAYIGQQVDVVEADGSLLVSSGGEPIGTFTIEE